MNIRWGGANIISVTYEIGYNFYYMTHGLKITYGNILPKKWKIEFRKNRDMKYLGIAKYFI